jgi:hypothetical protein
MGIPARLLTAREVNGLPAVPGHVGSHAFEDVTVPLEIDFGHYLVEFVQQRLTVSNAEITRWPHVVTRQGVHQIHLGRPGSYALHRDDIN